MIRPNGFFYLKKVFLSFFFIFILIQFIPIGDVESMDDYTRLSVNSEVDSILTKNCIECHSSGMHYDGIKRVAPISFLYHAEVEKGRKALNLSLWNVSPFYERDSLKAKIIAVIKNGHESDSVFGRDTNELDALEKEAILDWEYQN